MLILRVRDGEPVLIGEDVVLVTRRGRNNSTNLYLEVPENLPVRRQSDVKGTSDLAIADPAQEEGVSA
jgi:sRNA-binding carbon storage regulator CsrA